MKTVEIAAELGLAEGTVHAHLHAARARLTAGLRQYYPFDNDGNDGNDGNDNNKDTKDDGRGAAS
jgi:predicted transcriptional regulator